VLKQAHRQEICRTTCRPQFKRYRNPMRSPSFGGYG